MQYKTGDIVKGKVNRIESFGAFVSLPGKQYGLLPKVKSSDYYDYNAPQISDSKLNQKKYNFAV